MTATTENSGSEVTNDGRLSVVIAPDLDMEEIWRLRSLTWRADDMRHLRIDMGAVESVAPDALFLLHEELARQEMNGVRVRLDQLPAGLRRRLRWHPILRFSLEEDDLFTDPDLERVGFRPSRH